MNATGRADSCELGGRLAGLAPAILDCQPNIPRRLKVTNVTPPHTEGIIGNLNYLPDPTKGFYLNDGVSVSREFAGPYQLIQIQRGERYATDFYDQASSNKTGVGQFVPGGGYSYHYFNHLGQAGDFIVHDTVTGKSSLLTKAMIKEHGFIIHRCNELGELTSPTRTVNQEFGIAH